MTRGTEKLISSLGRDVVDYLNKFRALDNPVDIAAWKKFCEEHPSKDLQSELTGSPSPLRLVVS